MLDNNLEPNFGNAQQTSLNSGMGANNSKLSKTVAVTIHGLRAFTEVSKNLYQVLERLGCPVSPENRTLR